MLQTTSMGKQDRLRDLIEWSIEAYNLAAQVPAIDYTRKIDPTATQARPSLLMMGIDVKYIIHHQLSALPHKQADDITNWIQDGSQYAEYSLTYHQQKMLKINKNNIKQALINNGYRK